MDPRLAEPGRMTQRVLALIDEISPLCSEQDRKTLAVTRRQLADPLTVALVGRVSSGKSTLLNALVGDRVAPTDATECTRVVTMYTFGAPPAVDVVGLDGTRTELSGVYHEDLGRPADEIDFAVAYHHSARLRDEYRVIDTPGLAGFTELAQKATRRALIENSGLPKADVTLFLVNQSGPRKDEIEFLSEMGAARHNTLFLLSHADKVGQGAFAGEDPFELARVKAEKLAREHAANTVTVIPVSAKLAETGEMGVSPRDVRTLADLTDADVDDFLFGMLGGEPEAGLDRSPVARVHGLVGDYGIVYGREHAGQGAVHFCNWLRWRSGIDAVNRAIGERFVNCSPKLKARTALEQVRVLAFRADRKTDILTALEVAEADPALHPVRELAALDLVTRFDPGHPLVAELDHVTAAPSATALLGLPPDAPIPQIRAAAEHRMAACHRRRIGARTAPEREALTVLERTYLLVHRSARGV